MKPETLLARAIRDSVNATGMAWLEVNARGRRGRVPLGLMPDGSADLVGMLTGSGRFLAIEVKMPGEKPTPAQVGWLTKVIRAGGFAVWVCSLDEAMSAVKNARQLTMTGRKERRDDAR